MAEAATYTQLVDAYANQRDRLDERAMYAVRSIISGFEGWYSDAQVRDMAAQIVQQVEATQKATAQLTNAYLSRVAERVVGKPVTPPPIVDPGELRSGISHIVAYEALGMAYRFAVSKGSPPAEALASTLARGEAVGQMDNLLAVRAQSRDFISGSDALEGYRRVLRPELSRSGSCQLCKEASTRKYYKGELMPIHEHCHCGVLPFVGEKDPAVDLNNESLKQQPLTEEQIRARDPQNRTPGEIRAENERLAAERKAREAEEVEVHQHSEIGPVLRKKGDHFRGPDDIKPRVVVKEPPLTPAQRLARDQETLARTRAKLAPVKPRAAPRVAPKTTPAPKTSVPSFTEKQKAVFAKQKADQAKAARTTNPFSPEAIEARRLARRSGTQTFAPRKQTFALPPTPKINALKRKREVRNPSPVSTTQVRMDAKDTNPNYRVKKGYDVNCVHVVASHEMRRRGYAVQATEALKVGGVHRGRDAHEALRRWRNADGSAARFHPGLFGPKNIEAALMSSIPPGGRGWVRMTWKSGGGHIMNVERLPTGELLWVEAQTNKIVKASHYTGPGRGVEFEFVRVDQLVPTDGVMEFMEAGLAW